MKTGRVHGPSDVSLKLIGTSIKVGIQVMVELCKEVLDGMPVELVLSTVVQMIKGEGDNRSFNCYGAVNFLTHGLKVVERVLEKTCIE